MPPTRTPLSLCLQLLLLVPALAHAQETSTTYAACTHSPTDTDVAAAKGAFQAGNASFEEADYTRSILYWEDAYRRDCTAHALLLNLARAYELNGDRARAIVALRAYLQRVPASPDKAKIERRIEVLSKQLEPAPPIAAPEAPVTNEAAPVVETPKAVAAPPSYDAGAGTVPERAGSRSLTPLVLAGAGAVVAVVGAVLYFDARADVQAFRKECPKRTLQTGDTVYECPDDTDVEKEANEARTRLHWGGGMAIGGLAVAAGGLTWYLLSPRQPASSDVSRSPRVLPSLGPSFAGLSLLGGF